MRAKVSRRTIERYKAECYAIALELCAKYGLPPELARPMSNETAIEQILHMRKQLKKARYIGRCFARKMDNDILEFFTSKSMV